MSTDGAIPAERNVIKEQAEKILKYEYLTTEIQRMWNVKVKEILVVTGRLEPSQNDTDST